MEEAYELRCANVLHGIVVRPGVLEVACHSRYCGKRPGMILRHWFDIETGKLIDTKEYKTIELKQEG
jgi:hypothetical protein